MLNQIDPCYILWIQQRLHKELIRPNKLKKKKGFSVVLKFWVFFSPDFNTEWRCVSFLHLCNLKTKFLGLVGHSQLGQSMLLCVKVWSSEEQ